MKTKQSGTDFEDWYEVYYQILCESDLAFMAERAEAKALYNKNWTPQKAAQDLLDSVMGN